MKSSNRRVTVEAEDRVFCESSNFEEIKKHAGRPNRLNENRLAELLEAYYSHPYSLRELATMFGVSRMTVWRAVNNAGLA